MTIEDIQKAYGKYYRIFSDDITDDGWIGLSRYGWDEDYDKEESWDYMLNEIEFEEDHDENRHYWRPKILNTELKPTNDYKFCNHHHELTKNHQMVNFGDGDFVANIDAIPLLKALNEVGLKTRTHHYEKDKGGFISIILNDNINIEVKTINEIHSDRTKYNNKKELLIIWR